MAVAVVPIFWQIMCKIIFKSYECHFSSTEILRAEYDEDRWWELHRLVYAQYSFFHNLMKYCCHYYQ